MFIESDFKFALRIIFLDGNSVMGIVFFFIWGCFWGSFLNVCIYRLPYGRSIVFPGSSCPACGMPVKWWQNIPVLSFIVLKGKCHNCYSPISLRYPFIELITGIICAFLFHHYHGVGREFIYYFIFSNLLTVIFFIDLDHWLILDNITIPGTLFGLLGSFLVSREYSLNLDLSRIINYLPYRDHLHWQSFFESIAGMIIGYLLFYVIAITGSLLMRQEAMGLGDVKFAALIGAFLGGQTSIIAYVVSFFLGFIYALPLLLIKRKKGRDPVPFGTFMAMAAFIVLILGNQIAWWFYNWQYYLFPVY